MIKITPKNVFVGFLGFSLASSCSNSNQREKREISQDSAVEQMVDDYMNTHTIDSIGTDEDKRERVRSEVLKQNIKRDHVTGKVEMVN